MQNTRDIHEIIQNTHFFQKKNEPVQSESVFYDMKYNNNNDTNAIINIDLEKNGFEKHYRLTLDKEDIKQALKFQDLLEYGEHSTNPFSLEKQLKKDYPINNRQKSSKNKIKWAKSSQKINHRTSQTRKIKNRTLTPYPSKKTKNLSLKYRFPSLKKTKDFKF